MDIKGFFSALTELPALLALKRGLVPRPDTDRDCIGVALERNAGTIPQPRRCGHRGLRTRTLEIPADTAVNLTCHMSEPLLF